MAVVVSLPLVILVISGDMSSTVALPIPVTLSEAVMSTAASSSNVSPTGSQSSKSGGEPVAVRLEHLATPGLQGIWNDGNLRPTKLFVGGISRRTTTKQLRDHFSKHGRVLDCVAMRQPDGRPRGFGYVTLDTPEAAEHYLREPQTIDDRIVDVKPAVPDTTTEKETGAEGDKAEEAKVNGASKKTTPTNASAATSQQTAQTAFAAAAAAAATASRGQPQMPDPAMWAAAWNPAAMADMQQAMQQAMFGGAAGGNAANAMAVAQVAYAAQLQRAQAQQQAQAAAFVAAAAAAQQQAAAQQAAAQFAAFAAASAPSPSSSSSTPTGAPLLLQNSLLDQASTDSPNNAATNAAAADKETQQANPLPVGPLAVAKKSEDTETTTGSVATAATGGNSSSKTATGKLPPHLLNVPTPARRRPLEIAKATARPEVEVARSQVVDAVVPVADLEVQEAQKTGEETARLQAAAAAAGVLQAPPGLQLPPGLPAPRAAASAWFSASSGAQAASAATPAKKSGLLATPGASPLLSTSPKPVKADAKATAAAKGKTTCEMATQTCEIAIQTEDLSCPHCQKSVFCSGACAQRLAA